MSLVAEMWPILTLMRVLGWLPARRRHDTDTLQLRMRCLVYCALVLTLQLVPALFLCYRGIQAIPHEDPHVHLVYHVLVFTMTAPQLIPAFCALQAASHVKLFNDLSLFQKNLKSVSTLQEQPTLRIKRTARFVSALSFYPFLVMMIVRPIAFQRLPTFSFDLYLAFSGTNGILLHGWWLCCVSAVRNAAQQLSSEYKLLAKHNSCNASKLLAFRQLWLQLHRLVQHVGDALSLAQGFNFLLNSTFMLYALYELLSVQNIGPAGFFIAYVVIFSTVIYQVCFNAQRLKDTVYNGSIEAMQITKDMRVSAKVKSQMMDFLSHMAEKPAEVSFSGYISVGRGLIATMVSAMIGNLVVLVQLKIVTRRLTNQDFYRLGEFVTWYD